MALTLSDGSSVSAPRVFNVTYAQINHILGLANLPLAPTKHEYTEIALIEPPPELKGLAVTLMDGPFFSTMPYPAEQLYSLTHVRYTPHYSWLDEAAGKSAYEVGAALKPENRAQHMFWTLGASCRA